MQNYDYAILFDENGQPYVAHSVWGRVKSGAKKAAGRAASAGKTAHKYLLKVGEGAKARYAYTKEEVDALMGRGRQAVSDAAARTKEKVRDVSGASARDRMRAAENEKRRAYAANEKAYSEYRRARREDMRADVAAIKADAAKTMAGYAVAKSKDELKRASEEVALDRAELDKAEKRYARQHEQYYGDENSLGKTAARAVSRREREEHAEDKKELDRLDTARKDAYKTLEAGKRVLQEAKDNRREAMSEKRITDKEARQAEIDANYARAQRGETNLKLIDADVRSLRAELEYKRLKADYADTPLGKLESLAKNVKDAGKTAKDYASEKLDNVKDFASDKINDLKEAYENRQTKITKVEPANATLKDRNITIPKESFDKIVETTNAKTNGIKEKISDAKEAISDTAKRIKETIDAAQTKIEKEASDRQAAKEFKKATDAFSKWQEKHVRPSDNIFTLSKATGETVPKNRMYDFYIDQITQVYSEIADRPNMSAKERAEKISYANTLMNLAEGYAEVKR